VSFKTKDTSLLNAERRQRDDMIKGSDDLLAALLRLIEDRRKALTQGKRAS
jgi:hypothetical protein